MTWLTDFSEAAKQTDQLTEHPSHAALLAAGLLGECGSVLTELKKGERERDAYPAYRAKMIEELGDFLWYYVRLVAIAAPHLLSDLPTETTDRVKVEDGLGSFLQFGHRVGVILAEIEANHPGVGEDEIAAALRRTWDSLLQICFEASIEPREAARLNIQKVRSRWPNDKVHHPLFDQTSPEEEQLPRQLEIEFRDRKYGNRHVMVLRCNGLNFGDRLTDNIDDPDGYRYHDVFHFAYAVHLGWSPVIRALLRCKRKSDPTIDENQDGGRARVVEEGIAAMAFARAKRLGYFDGIDHVDYNLLKTISEFVAGFEVEEVPLWQWETAILEGFRLFRLLRANRGGTIEINLEERALVFRAPAAG